MTEQSMIERVEIAIRAALEKETGTILAGGGCFLAAAAIAAMREPTEAMNNAGRLRMVSGPPDRSGISYPTLGLDNGSSAYRRMIDAALAEPT